MNNPFGEDFYKELEKFYYRDEYVQSMSEMLISTVISFNIEKEKEVSPEKTESEIYIELSKRLLLMGDMLRRHGETYYPNVFNKETLS